MFNEDILIDKNALDEECSRAPAFFDYWQTQESNLRIDLENCEADISRDIRSCDDSELHLKYGMKKVTDAAVSAAVKSDINYRRLRGQYLQAEANRKAYDKKILLLDVLAKLHGQGYFSKVESKKESRTLMAKHVREQIAKQIRERKVERPSRKSKNV